MEAGQDDNVALRSSSVNEKRTKRQSSIWHVFGKRVPRSEMVFVCQIILIYIVVVVSLVNLSQDNGPVHLWVALLSSAIGYVLPNPSIDRKPEEK